MLPRRSGAEPRFLLHRSPDSWAIPSRLLVYNLLLGFLPLLGAIGGCGLWGGAALSALLDPRDSIHRLTRPLPPDEVARGARRLSVRITGGEVCYVSHERDEGKSTHEDFHRADAADGASLTVESAQGEGVPEAGSPLPIVWRDTSWEPHPWLHEVRDEARQRYWEHRLLTLPSGRGRLLEGCLRPGDRLFIDVAPPGLPLPFSLAPTLELTVVTPGDGTARPRVAQLVASCAGHASMLAYAVILLILYLWRVFGARPFAAPLIQRLIQPLLPLVAPSARLVLALTPLALAAWFFGTGNLLERDGAAAVERWGWLVAHFAALSGIITALRLADRRAALGAAMALVRAGRRPALDRAREGEPVGVDVAVDAAAPVSKSLLGGRPRAHWAVRVTRIFKAARSYTTEKGPSHDGPLLVPVTGKGGAALLDMTHAVTDVRAARKVVGQRALRRGRYAAIFGEAWAAGSRYVIEERFLDRGERVHVIGRVVRFAPAAGGGGQVPVIGGTAAEPVVVHAGSRRTLLRGLAVERGFLTAAVPASLAVTAAVAVLAAYLGSR